MKLVDNYTSKVVLVFPEEVIYIVSAEKYSNNYTFNVTYFKMVLVAKNKWVFIDWQHFNN